MRYREAAGDRSRMSGDVHVRFWESAGVKLPRATHLRSKTDTAMVNEALCKVLCHNVCVLIQSSYEFGIELGQVAGAGQPSPVRREAVAV